MFLELSATRGSNGYSLNPLTFKEIEAYNNLSRANLSREEVYLLRQADEAFLRQMAENYDREKDL